MTSLAFMLVEVPAPPWSASTTKCASNWPAMTSSEASAMAAPIAGSSTPRATLAWAAAFLMAPRARMSMAKREMGKPVMGKFSSARRVWMP